MIKMVIASIMGAGLYLFLSYYQPVMESSGTTQVEAAQIEGSMPFVSPIPYDLLILPQQK